jgi:hypothetical protein
VRAAEAIALGIVLCALPGAALPGDIYVVGSLTRDVTLQPGGKAEGRIILKNTGNEPREVRIYQTDYMCHAGGDSEYGEPGSVARSNASWITFAPRQLVIAPGETDSVYYTVRVPSDEALSGTYWSIIMAEPLPARTAAASPADGDNANIGIKTVVRYGIQVVSNIGGTGTMEMRFADRRLVASDGGVRALRLDIENTGQKWLNPLVWADLYDSGGACVGRFTARRLRIYPGCSGRFDIDISHVPEGAYHALIVADNGDESVFGAECTLQIE